MTPGARLVAVAGATCTGKTRFARQLAAHLAPRRVAVLSFDSYYRDTAHLTHAEKLRVNHDEPEALDRDRLREDLAALLAGGSVPRRRYDFRTGAVRHDGALGPADVVVIEGILALREDFLGTRADLRVLLEGDEALLLARRIRRDVSERGYSEAETRSRFAGMVLPAQRRWLRGAERVADLRLPADWTGRDIARTAARLAAEPRQLPASPVAVA